MIILLKEPEKIDLNLIGHRELLGLKNLSCSPMSFATKILFKIFKIEELHGHNVSGKTLNKNQKAKLPLDPVRIGYIRFLVEKYYDEKECKEMLTGATSHKQDLWKSCHTAINKSILISERKAAAAAANGLVFNVNTSASTNGESENEELNKSIDTLDSESRRESSSESDVEIEPKVGRKSRKTANEENEQRRRSTRIRKPNNKFRIDFDNEFDEEDDESEDEDSDEEEDDEEMDEESEDDDGQTENINEELKVNFPLDIEIKEEDEGQNEIELIQNIENRLNNSKQLILPFKSSPKPNGAKLPVCPLNPSPPSSPPRAPTPPPQQSSEASAAANIAAAMKKRFVVIAAVHKPH